MRRPNRKREDAPLAIEQRSEIIEAMSSLAEEEQAEALAEILTERDLCVADLDGGEFIALIPEAIGRVEWRRRK